MKKILKKYSLTAALMATLCLLPASCITDDAPAPTEKAAVTMTFRTRVVTTRTTEPAADNEQMKTLRVIMAKKNSKGTEEGDILHNVYYDNLSGGSKTVTLSDIPVAGKGTEYDFYAIANEAVLAGAVSLEGETLNLADLKEKIIETDFNQSLDNGLPQAYFRSYIVLPNQSQSFDMQLLFPVAKVRVKFVNDTDQTQVLNDIKMPRANPGKGYLFAQQDFGLPTFSVSRYSDLLLSSTTLSIASKGDSEQLVGYLYPGTIDTGYVLVADWQNVGEQTLEIEDSAGAKLINLEAGQCLDIVITLTGPKDTQLQWSVGDWNNVNIDVPFE